MHSLEQATRSFGVHVNANKTEYMMLMTKSDVDVPLAMVWAAIDKLSIIWKSDLSDDIK